ncbi:Aste57867_10322 [Aphanomyces stellatus]|uniref:Aste57867_10322 protein n=1 Tax=Aphanomyces stellatus TaxID=120398 RepID=A0A485KQ18_9STRA|nr:hypothetical protein As57867_010282 [Aphanomyces stellatus]VFT87196.1 Aste57867_10322 [Aphanomyces stellatus]
MSAPHHPTDIESPKTAATFHDIETPRDDPTPKAKSNRFRLLGGLVALCGVACVAIGAVVVAHHKDHTNAVAVASAFQDASAVKLTLRFKRASMFYNGQDSANVYVFPRPSTDGSTIDFDGLVSLTHDNTTEKYVYANDRGYFVQSRHGNLVQASCLRASQLPVFTTLQSTLRGAAVVDIAQVGDVALSADQDCPNGKLVSVKFGGDAFVACLTENNQIAKVYGNDMDIDVTYLSALDDDIPSLEVPSTTAAGAPLNCPVHQPQDAPAPASLSLTQKATSLKNTLMGTRSLNLFGPSCSCQAEPKPCLMVHGVANPIAGPMTDTFPFYWGDVHNHLPCCSSVKFVHFDTINTGWSDDSIQQDFCNAALQVSRSSTKSIGKLTIISHSMGNMIAGAALATGKCTMSDDVTWISSAGPMRGSKAANLLLKKCTDGGLNDIIKKPLEFINFCPPTHAFASLYYQTTMPKATQDLLVASAKMRNKHVTKSLCGTDGFGIQSIFSVALQVVGVWAQHGDVNDGVVALESCTAGLEGDNAVFGGDLTSTNYIGPLNHEDLAFRNGDGWLGDNRKPVKWLECAL